MFLYELLTYPPMLLVLCIITLGFFIYQWYKNQDENE